MLVSPNLNASLERISDYFNGIELHKDAKSRLEGMKVAGFVPFDEAPLKALGQWLAVG